MFTFKFIIPVAIGCSDITDKERRDCAVRALCNSSEKSYEECLRVFKQYGRASGKGTDVRVLPSLFKEQGYTCLLLGDNKNSKYVKYYNPSISSMQKSMTVATLLRSPRYSKGNHTFVISGHAFAVVNGEIIDKNVVKANSRVFMIFTKIR